MIITGTNDIPTAVDDIATTTEDASRLINLTSNDTDPDKTDDLEILNIDTTGTIGTVTVNPNNDTVVYDPNGQFNSLIVGEIASDTFTYTVSDGNGGTDTATTTVTIIGTNDIPIAVDDTAPVSEDRSRIINLTTNDTDPNATDDLEILNIDTASTVGTVSVNPNNDSVVYDPNGQFEDLAVGETATDTFIYTISDGKGETDTATVTVTIVGRNDESTAVDDIATIEEDSFRIIDLTGNDTDPDTTDDVEILNIDTTGTSGTVTINPNNDTVVYDPNGQFEDLAVGETAKDTFAYSVSDGNGGTDTATATVTIVGRNDEPTAVEDTVTTVEGTSRFINLTRNDTDPDTTDDLEILNIDTTSTVGIVTVNLNNDSVIYDPSGQFEDLAFGETATDTFTYTVSDGNGGTETATATVTITGTNDSPTAIDDSGTIEEDSSRIIDLTSNDTDPDISDDLEILDINTTGTAGTVTINPNDDSVIYDPNGQFEDLDFGETATDTFEYTVSDENGGTDTATATVTIVGRNDGPTADNDSATVAEERSRLIDLTSNDTDPDSNDDPEILDIDTTGTVGTVTINPNNDTVVYDPNGQFEDLAVGETATDTFTYTVSDGNGGTDTATATVTIVGRNDEPTAVEDTATVAEDRPRIIDLTGNDTDPDLTDDPEILDVDISGTVGTVTVNPNDDSVVYDPNGQFEDLAVGETATDTFTYTVSDGHGGTATATATVTIVGRNDGPIAEDDTFNASPNTTTPLDVLDNDSDIDDDPLSILNATARNGDVTISNNGNLLYTPDPGFTGTETITYTITDGNGGIDTATATIEPDSDGDGVIDRVDLDDDNDGILDSVEGNGDTDGDGVLDRLDLDSDNDGLRDLEESGLLDVRVNAWDTDEDGRIDPQFSFGDNGLVNALESTPESGTTDHNNDGTPDTAVDTDGDGAPDFQDLDSDNDGITDVIEAGGLDPDGDGLVASNTPADRNGDGFADFLSGNSLSVFDTDDDGTPDYQELDSDDDGLSDFQESGNPLGNDLNADGVVDGPDSDGDGLINSIDETAAFGNSRKNRDAILDSDGDGTPDYRQQATSFTGRGTQNPDLIIGTDRSDSINGFSDKDTLIGAGGDDTINGGSSPDILEGGTGNDILSGGSNNDFVLGERGADTLTGGTGNDTLNGGLDDDLLLGSSGLDLLVGAFGRDALFGGNGNDILIGGAGADTLQGGQGEDIFRYRNVSEFGDVILDFSILEDVIDVSGIFQGVSGSFSDNVSLNQAGKNTVVRVSVDGTLETLGVLLNVNQNTLDTDHFKGIG